MSRHPGVRDDFTDFYQRESNRLVRCVALTIGEPAVAEDSVAEAFARAWSRWPQVGATQQPAAWVMRVALNHARDRFRRRRVEWRKGPVVARPEAVHDPQPHLDHHLWDAVRALPLPERTVVALRYVADLPQADIAAVLGVPPGTVASRLNRARRTLGAALGSTIQEELA